MNWPLFFFNDTATTEIYTLSLHDALPISVVDGIRVGPPGLDADATHEAGEHAPAGDQIRHGDLLGHAHRAVLDGRSEEHTSELQSLAYLVCRLLLEKTTSPCRSRWCLASPWASRDELAAFFF